MRIKLQWPAFDAADGNMGGKQTRPWRDVTEKCGVYGAIERRPESRCTRNKTIAMTNST